MNTETQNTLLQTGVSQLAIDALISEREHQEGTWNPETTSSGGDHNEIEFLVFIQDYLQEAIHIVSRGAEPLVSISASDTLRKITAMACATAEKNNWSSQLIEKDYTQLLDNHNLVMTFGLIQHHINEGYANTAKQFPESVKLNVASIFWLGMHTMSLKEEFAPKRLPKS